jgi:hypothetical protein
MPDDNTSNNTIANANARTTPDDEHNAHGFPLTPNMGVFFLSFCFVLADPIFPVLF